MLLKAEKLVVQGIPNVLRSLLWVKLAGISDSHLQSWYSTTLKKSSPHDSQIRRDVARTFPNHSFFSKKGEIGQETLYKVVKAYSLYDPELGYCQGIAFVVGILLLQLPEEDSFTVLTVLMQKV
ncbi:EVI5-like protein [Zophobas morio]|uniref:EVI5-like protein n=1 Tax=Zophobas morio TaxID=2755281 RepID=UPI003082B56C